MSDDTYDIYAIGNALVDAEFSVSHDFLQKHQLSPGQMTLVDAPARQALLAALADTAPRIAGGGSAGNTVVAVSQLGGRAFYSCRVANDAWGAFYAQDLQAHAVDSCLSSQPLAQGQTGSCVVLITPDAERTMCTHLGATAELDSTALDAAALARSKVYYMEGYLAASATGLQAALDGLHMAKSHGVQTALTLSDVSMVTFARSGLEAMASQGLDLVFANEHEARAWCGPDADQADALHMLTQLGRLAHTVCLTQGAQGCWVQHGSERFHVPAVPTQAIDTNGAGDVFAGAFLYGMTQGKGPLWSAQLATRAGAALVAQHGSRLTVAQMRGVQLGASA